MNISAFGIRVLSIALAAAMGACGAQNVPGAVPHAAPHARRASGSSGALLYVVTSRNGVDVLAYPEYRKVGTLWKGHPVGAVVTSNPANGNILLDVYGEILEYAHGGHKPIATIKAPHGGALYYAFDGATSNIAVTALASNGDSTVVAVYTTPSSTPSTYQVPNMEWPGLLGYDNQGNLFVEGRTTANGPWLLAELPKGGTAFIDITLNETLTNMGTVQWDGSYITVACGNTIYQIQTSGSNGIVVGQTTLARAWAQHPWYWIQGDTVIGDYVSANHTHNGRSLGIWNYPQGGKAIKVIGGLSTSKKDRLESFAVSVAPSHK